MAEESNPLAPHADDGIFEAAEEWAGRRPAKALVCELFVRITQLAMMTLNMTRHLGLDLDGLPPTQPPDGPAPAPAV